MTQPRELILEPIPLAATRDQIEPSARLAYAVRDNPNVSDEARELAEQVAQDDHILLLYAETDERFKLVPVGFWWEGHYSAMETSCYLISARAES
jgi:hypothetical protein